MRARDFKKRMLIAVSAGLMAALAVYVSINNLNSRIERQNATIQSLTEDLNKASAVEGMVSSKNSSKYHYVVAKTKIFKGQRISAEMLEEKDFGYEQLNVADNVNVLAGKIAMNDIEEGSIVPNSSIFNGDGIVYSLEKGMRAINLPINYIQGYASFIKPGTRVDIASSQRDLKDSNRVILQNVEILSIETASVGAKSETGNDSVSALVIKVPAASTSKLVNAMADGKLILFARSANDVGSSTVTKKVKHKKRSYNSIPSDINFGDLYLPPPTAPQKTVYSQSVEFIQAGSKSQVTFEGQ